MRVRVRVSGRLRVRVRVRESADAPRTAAMLKAEGMSPSGYG